MSRRTSEANKAIAMAWTKELKLVQKGKGTRDWSPEEQQDILERGKAYDENGKALEGHHMKSAEMYPEYQGNPQNIQFLSRQDHFSAHYGNFQNPTNGFYDYSTGDTIQFDMDIIKPCAIIELTRPIVKVNDDLQDKDNIDKEYLGEENQKSIAAARNDELKHIQLKQNVNTSPNVRYDFGGKFIRAIDNIKSFSKCHPVISRIVKWACIASTTVAVEVLSKSEKSNSEDGYGENSCEPKEKKNLQCFTSNESNIEYTKALDESKRPSPNKHTVRPHGQHYGKDKIWIEKESYQRGNNNEK